MLLALKTAKENSSTAEFEEIGATGAVEEIGALKKAKDIPVGAVIVHNGQLICASGNRKEILNDVTAHAEIVALREAAAISGTWRCQKGTTIYTTLEPCPMCAEAILQARVAKVVFGAYDPLSGALGSAFNLYGQKRIYPVPEVVGGILESECSNLLKEFFAQNRSD